ncbi:MAG: arylsulfatase [Gemmatimonadetes bacterium]|nr:arylsulfatase [Gemmatimonadota bacterium]
MPTTIRRRTDRAARTGTAFGLVAGLFSLAVLPPANAASAENAADPASDAAPATGETAAPAPDPRPNFVIIMADDMGMSDLGCFGGEIETPALDALAQNGLRFTRFYSSNKCTPTRASLLTGVNSAVALNRFDVDLRCATIAELLGPAGYSTNLSGKWHLARKNDLPQYPVQRGFDRYFGNIIGAASYYAPAALRRQNENATAEADDNPDFYYTDAISQDAVWMIEATPAEQPIFLYVAYTAPHWPLHARESDIAKYEGRYAEGWDVIRRRRFERMRELGVIPPDTELSPRDPEVPAWEDVENKAWEERRMEVYAAQVEVMDQGIGRIVDCLRETDRLDNTLLIFVMDNGACHVEYDPDRSGSYMPRATRDGRPMKPGNLPDVMPGPEDTYQSYGRGWANVSAVPFRLFKEYCHEGGIITPLVVHWPEGLQTEPGALTDQVGHVIDFVPTWLDLAGVQHPERYKKRDLIPPDGRSLAPIFRGEIRPAHDVLFWDYALGSAVRQGPWKLVRQEREFRWRFADVMAWLRGEARGDWELYAIQQDRTEMRNVADQMPDKVAELKTLWTQWRKAADKR